MSTSTIPKPALERAEPSTHAGVLRYIAALLDHTDLPAPLAVDTNGPDHDGVARALKIGLRSRAEIELWAPIFDAERVSSQDYLEHLTLTTATGFDWHGWYVYLSATEPRLPVAGSAPTDEQMAAVAAAVLTPDADLLPAGVEGIALGGPERAL